MFAKGANCTVLCDDQKRCTILCDEAVLSEAPPSTSKSSRRTAMAKLKSKSKKRRKKAAPKKGRMVCPKRYKGAKVKSRRMRGGVRCYIKKKTGQWRFVSKVKAGRRKS